jgi:ABC-type transporter Mla maintaining outer membrane lipid asymmetry ATPase subunit MlaF
VPDVVVENLTKRFGSNVVLDKLSFSIADGELFTLLGPSGPPTATPPAQQPPAAQAPPSKPN